MVHSFSFGYQRELDKNTVVEVRYVGNRGRDLMRQININQLNVIENGVAAEFALAQQNLYANIAANRCQAGVTAVDCQYNFAYFGPGTGTVPLPISLAYISGGTIAVPNPNGSGTINITNTVALTPGAVNQSGTVTSAAGGAALNPAAYSNALFRNIAFAQNLNRASPTALTFGANLEGANARRANALTAGLPANFFFINPTTATSGAWIVESSAKSWYDSGVLELRRRLSDGLRFQASYVWSKAQSDSFQSAGDLFANYSLREGGLELAKNVAVFDIRHSFKLDATYDLPFGKGTPFFSNANGFVNALVGGWSILPVIRWQSGSPISFGNVSLVGMTAKDLQKEIKIRKDSIQGGINVVTWLPDDIIANTQRAFNTDVTNRTAGAQEGYGTTFGTGGPQGRFIAPASYGGCVARSTGDCGFTNLILYGPSFFKFDVTFAKKFKIDEKRNVELRATMLDALNHPNFRIGGWAADTVGVTLGGSTFAQLGAGSAYQDLSTTNDPGGRLIDLMLRINF
jgi:tRNA(Leu) C34 or U34 (ribose-2'-O)-methylase TrmL